MKNVWIALKIMGAGMAGIFVTILLIMLVVWIMAKITNRSPKEEKEQNS